MTELEALRTEIDELRYDLQKAKSELYRVHLALNAYLTEARDANFSARDHALQLLRGQ